MSRPVYVTFQRGYCTSAINWPHVHGHSLEQQCHLTNKNEDIVR